MNKVEIREERERRIFDMAVITILLTAIIVAFVSFPALAATSREYMTVTSVTRETGEVTLVDRNGNLWCFIGYGFSPTEMLIVDMFDNNTSSYIYDDIIVNVKRVY